MTYFYIGNGRPQLWIHAEGSQYKNKYSTCGVIQVIQFIFPNKNITIEIHTNHKQINVLQTAKKQTIPHTLQTQIIKNIRPLRRKKSLF